jgi:hypothetical protein
LLGTIPRPWQDTRTILAQFGPTQRRARQAYRTFVQAGVATQRRPDLQGGGLVRSLGGWDAVRRLRRGREAYLGDERILGCPEFVEAIRREAEQAAAAARPPGITLEILMARVCEALGVVPAALVAGGRTARVSRAREGIAYLWVTMLGHAGRPLAAPLGIRPQNVYRAAAQGATAAGRWQQILAQCVNMATSSKPRRKGERTAHVG